LTFGVTGFPLLRFATKQVETCELIKHKPLHNFPHKINIGLVHPWPPDRHFGANQQSPLTFHHPLCAFASLREIFFFVFFALFVPFAAIPSCVASLISVRLIV
jgi:hypothetical protein